MSKRKIILSFVILLCSFAFSCSESNESQEDNIEQENKSKEEFTPSDESVFNLESKWLNQDNKEVQLNFLSGKPTVLAMIYTHCQYSCPLIVKDMKKIYTSVPDGKKKEINFLLVSIDPEHDQPDTLSTFMKDEQMKERDWTMLTSTETNIRELAAVMGFKYKKSSLMDYAHSNLITVLNKKGEIVKQIDGFGTDRSELIEEILKQSD